MSSNHSQRYLVSKIQDGSQQTENSNMSETMTHSIKIPTATTLFSGSAFLVVVLPMSWDVDVCWKSKMAAELPGSTNNLVGFTVSSRWAWSKTSYLSLDAVIGDVSISGLVSTLPFPVAGHCCNQLATLYSGSPWSRIPDLPLEFQRCLL